MKKLYVSYFNGKYPAKFRVREFSKKDNANTFIKEIKDKGGKASFTQTCFGAELVNVPWDKAFNALLERREHNEKTKKR